MAIADTKGSTPATARTMTPTTAARYGRLASREPRVLPTINMVDALLYPERKTVVLLNTSKSVGQTFQKLFFESFQLPLEMADPLRLGFRSGLDPEAQHSLQRAEPIRWFREGEARTRRAVESNDDEMETEA